MVSNPWAELDAVDRRRFARLGRCPLCLKTATHVIVLNTVTWAACAGCFERWPVGEHVLTPETDAEELEAGMRFLAAMDAADLPVRRLTKGRPVTTETLTIEPSLATDPRHYVRDEKDAQRLLHGTFPNFRQLIGAHALQLLLETPDAERKDIAKLVARLNARVQSLPYGDRTVGQVLSRECGHLALHNVLMVFLQAGTFRQTLLEQQRLIGELLAKLTVLEQV